jgi:hypothetical protein
VLLSPAAVTRLSLTHLPMTSIYTHSLLDPTLCPDASQRVETWAVCTVVGGGRASAMALAEEHKHMKLIPWAGVAGRIGLTAPGDGDKVRRGYLPIETHIYSGRQGHLLENGMVRDRGPSRNRGGLDFRCQVCCRFCTCGVSYFTRMCIWVLCTWAVWLY